MSCGICNVHDIISAEQHQQILVQKGGVVTLLLFETYLMLVAGDFL